MLAELISPARIPVSTSQAAIHVPLRPSGRSPAIRSSCDVATSLRQRGRTDLVAALCVYCGVGSGLPARRVYSATGKPHSACCLRRNTPSDPLPLMSRYANRIRPNRTPDHNAPALRAPDSMIALAVHFTLSRRAVATVYELSTFRDNDRRELRAIKLFPVERGSAP